MPFVQQSANNRTIIVGILIALFSYGILGIIQNLLTTTQLSVDNLLLLSRLALWLSFAVLCFYSFKIEQQPLLLWKDRTYSVKYYMLSIIVILTAVAIGFFLIAVVFKLAGISVNNHSKRLETMVLIFKRNKFLMVFSALTAGITEELIFRGYLIPRLQLFFKQAYLPIFLSALFFGLMHISYGTLMQVLGPFYLGLLFGIYYYKYRNIKVLIICHFLWDLFALIAKTR